MANKINFTNNKITQLLGIEYPIIQGGMIWCSSWELASAVSNAGGLGVLGAGSMYPEVLASQILKCQANTNKPFAVNIPLLYPNIEAHIQTVIDLKVSIVITSAGNPKTWTSLLKKEGIKVIHVIANAKFTKKCEEAGVDALVCEGFEAGGHNGREETTTLCLIPSIKAITHLPIIAAGGIATGRAMLATMILGANAIQMGSRFVASEESSAHPAFKNKVVEAKEGDTLLSLKKLTPVRLLKNEFAETVRLAEQDGASIEVLKEILGRAKAKKGMFEGDIKNGELEIGQVSALIDAVKPVKEIFKEILEEYALAINEIKEL